MSNRFFWFIAMLVGVPAVTFGALYLGMISSNHAGYNTGNVVIYPLATFFISVFISWLLYPIEKA